MPDPRIELGISGSQPDEMTIFLVWLNCVFLSIFCCNLQPAVFLYIIHNSARFPKPAILKKPIHLVLILTLIHHAFWLFGLVVGLEERRECLREVQNYFEFIKSGHNKGKKGDKLLFLLLEV